VIAPFPNTYRYRWDNQIGIVDYCLSELDQILNSQSTPSETAAMIVEPVLGEGGFVPAPPRFLQGLRNVCDATGILLIVDEVQTGFGRTGNMWGHSSSNIVPDIMTMAKGIASGLPLSAIGASRDLMNKWPPGAHGGTYGGGSALAMVAAIATLNIIQEENLVENAVAMGNHLRKRLQAIVANIDIPSEIRGPGLMIGIELGTPEEPNSGMASRIQTKCLEHGLMLLTCGPNGNVIRWVPPLNVTKAEIDSAVDIFSSCF
jgi:4-aminobutyrate aminotransferase-like enzyme